MTQTSSPGRAVVLIVEDEPIVRMMVIDLFEDEGFEVLEAATGDQALTIFDERRDVALLFTDVEMPGSIDGYALAHWVHANRPGVKTVIVSGRAMPKAGDMPEGAAFVGKPYDHDDVMRRIQSMMAG